MKNFMTGTDSIPFLPGTFAPEIDGAKEEEALGARPAEIIRIAGSTPTRTGWLRKFRWRSSTTAFRTPS